MLINEGYRLIKQISKGGFYQTFLAVDESQFPPIHCVVYQVSSRYQPLEIFQFQVQKLTELGKHPQIPTLITHFIENEYYYLIEEFIDGDNLASLLAKQGSFQETQIWQILKCLLPVIRFIHDHQIIHRNIQPENIIVRTKNQNQDLLDDLVLGDFANMKFANINEDTDHLVGSPEYISPEQAQGKAVFASDLYSLGVTCIYLLTQISPFELFDVTSNGWIWQDYLTYPISEHLGQTLDKLVEFDVQERWQSADQLIYNLGIKDNYLPLLSIEKSHLWQLAYTLENKIYSSINTVALSHDSKILASGEDNKSIKLWNLSNQQLIRNFPGHTQSVTAVIFNHNDTILATASDDQTINLWDVKTLTKIHSLTGHSHAVKSLAFHPHGQILASGSWDKTIKIWDVNTGLALNTLTGHKLQVNAVAFSPQGQLLASASYDRTVRVWKLENGNFHLLTTLLGHTWAVLTVAFSPTDPHLLATGSGDNTIKLWDVSTDELISTLSGHSWSVVAVAFSADGETLISGSWDKTVKIWQISTKLEIASLVGHVDSVSSVVMGGDGELIISGSKDKTIKLWRR
ncbi:WD40 repeat domain-containing serine/threonine-protein kinase [Aphanizomenon sp. CS-733/32]|uniref:WD40 repeat domain-containing serine/threonine-protein kinase n=1 Tax=Aphanizomenon sp. CS-733/32 TaxID=3021715 RepID=UPI00232E8E8B|nr:WD40 repeat domain-containing serine/threonine-protein kinase [Aphanizomenon sp. CS-733/32]MDB9311170.1 WD40 repeat domain-containing serine/threonine-protein kinase [Aphanizomenon sp. CS-733/32]